MYAKFEDSGSHRSREFCLKLFEKKKDKWTNKGEDKHEDADSLLHDTTSYPMFLQNFKILGIVVPQKSSTKYFVAEKKKMDK